jgi:hypothetical protein
MGRLNMLPTENTECCFTKYHFFPLFFTVQRKKYVEDKYYCFVSEYLVFYLYLETCVLL